ncbi:hypothetical protein E2C01_089756 [Portunus trituberculatus]|uniref:Uncharacterized protein n=1 Tax=Portunus trituberculatus TaxID=210409 RepID=A0A5B7JEG3_PORTR|nr:hypothetical protein [Portunus trituberculatus]
MRQRKEMEYSRPSRGCGDRGAVLSERQEDPHVSRPGA